MCKTILKVNVPLLTSKSVILCILFFFDDVKKIYGVFHSRRTGKRKRADKKIITISLLAFENKLT